MSRFAFLFCIALVVAPAYSQEVVQPEDCLLREGEAPAASVEFDGKTYGFRSVACRDQFASDPERYSQLYEALAEMAAAGRQLRSRPTSLVPS
jgi:YHS domain-containing protein